MTTREVDLGIAVAQAVLAPSSHNTQPWLFAVGDGVVELRADRSRRLAVNDPADRELTISCGAALLNLRCALAAQGAATAVELLPVPGDPDLLARVRVREASPDPEDAALTAVVASRRTSRKPFGARSVPPEVWREVAGAAAVEGGSLVAVDTSERAALAELVGEGDRAQFADPQWRRELAGWLRPRRAGDGLSYPAPVAPVARFVVRSLDLGARTAGSDRRLALTAPLLAVLTTGQDDPRGWLTAGLALERALLVAAQHGVLAGFLNQPCQVDALRPRLRELLSLEGHAQLVLRLGFPTSEPSAAPRRPVQAVTLLR